MAYLNRTFNRIARLDVHLEKTGFVKSYFEAALPETQENRRTKPGADAVIAGFCRWSAGTFSVRVGLRARMDS